MSGKMEGWLEQTFNVNSKTQPEITPGESEAIRSETTVTSGDVVIHDVSTVW